MCGSRLSGQMPHLRVWYCAGGHRSEYFVLGRRDRDNTSCLLTWEHCHQLALGWRDVVEDSLCGKVEILTRNVRGFCFYLFFSLSRFVCHFVSH